MTKIGFDIRDDSIYAQALCSGKDIQEYTEQISLNESLSHPFERLKKRIENDLKFGIENADFSYPVYFDDKRKRKFRHAAALAGIRAQKINNRAQAAASFYGLDEVKSNVLIIDLEKDFFEVSFLETSGGSINVKESDFKKRLSKSIDGDLFLLKKLVKSVLQSSYIFPILEADLDGVILIGEDCYRDEFKNSVLKMFHNMNPCIYLEGEKAVLSGLLNIKKHNFEEILQSFKIDGNEDSESYEEKVDKLIKEAESLYNNFNIRIQTENWVKLLNSDVTFEMDSDGTFLCDKFVEFLENHHFFPKEVWNIFEDNFSFTRQKSSLIAKFQRKSDLLNYIFEKVESKWNLAYYPLDDNEKFDYDKFLEYREKAYKSLYEMDQVSAEKFINKAEEIYDKDIQIYIMKGRCLLYKDKLNEAAAVFDDVIKNHNNYIDVFFNRAEVLFKMGGYQEALEDLKYLEEKSYESRRFYKLYAHISYILRDFEKSKQMLLKLDTLSDEEKDILKKINLILANKIKKELKINKKNNELQARFDDICRELGVLTDSQIKKKINGLAFKTILALILVVFIHILLCNIGIKDIGFNKLPSSDNLIQFVSTLNKGETIESIDDISKHKEGYAHVHGTLTDAVFLDLYRIPVDKDNIFLSSDEAKERDLFKDMTGYVCVGKLNGTYIMTVTNYDDAEKAYNTKTLDFDGIIHYEKNQNLIDAVKLKYKNDSFEDKVYCDAFLDTNVNTSKLNQFVIVMTACFFIDILLIFNLPAAAYIIIKKNKKKLYLKENGGEI